MNVLLAGMIGGWEMVLILAVVLVLFGAKKLPELAKGLGTGIKEFKKATRDVQDELTTAMDDSHNQRRFVSQNSTTPAPEQPASSTPSTPANATTTATPAANTAPATPQVKTL
jgi:sec-independent protein translocase protein TatA